MNHHFEDSHARRAEHDHYAESISAMISDLIHDGAEEMGEEFDDMTAEGLREVLAVQ